MPRYRRALLAGLPHHIVQRGHDRQPVFVSEADYHQYLNNLSEQLLELNIALLSFCLMTNHVHLLLRPEREGEDLSRLMRVLAARQTRFVNRLERRSGTLWEGRFKCSIVDSDRYLLACCRYIELNPVRAGIVRRPDDYPWSSYRSRVGSDISLVSLTSFESFSALGDCDVARRQRYRDFVSAHVDDQELQSIRIAVARNQLTGSQYFKAQIERRLDRRLSDRAPGRPSKASTPLDK